MVTFKVNRVPLCRYTEHRYVKASVSIRTFGRSEIADFFFDGKTDRTSGWIGFGKIVAGVNDRWRIVFRWTSAGQEDVDVTDYHALRRGLMSGEGIVRLESTQGRR